MVAFEYSSGSLRITNAASTDTKGVELSFKGVLSTYITSNRAVAYEILAGAYNGSSAITSINISLESGSFSQGTWKLWGAS